MKETNICIFFILFTLSFSFSVNQLEGGYTSNNCDFPLITEFIRDYELPAMDLEYFVEKNMSTFTLNTLGTSKTALFQNIQANVQHDESKREIIKTDKLKWNIVNDSIKLVLNFKAKVSKTFTSTTYEVKMTSSKIPINYTKSIDISTGSYLIENTKIDINSDQLTNVTYTPTPSSGDLDKINQVIKSSLVPALVVNFNDLNSQLNSNAQKQTLSQIYSEKNYNYRFYNTPFSINMASKSIQIQDDSAMVNGLNGNIDGQSSQQCPQQNQKEIEDYTQFFSIEFIRNLAQAGIQQYPVWKSLSINSTWIRSVAFQFKLVDLQFVMNSKVFETYGSLYMSPISFTCGIKQIVSLYLDSQKPFIHALVAWKCQGYIISTDNLGNEQNKIILDFEPEIDHQVYLSISSNDQLSAYANVLKVGRIKYNPVQDFQVVNEDLAKIYMDEMFNDFRTYVFGTYFKVKSNSKKIKFQADKDLGSGIWIG